MTRTNKRIKQGNTRKIKNNNNTTIVPDTQFQKLQLKIEYANNVTVRQLRMKNTY
jgi:hypothetical protein